MIYVYKSSYRNPKKILQVNGHEGRNGQIIALSALVSAEAQ